MAEQRLDEPAQAAPQPQVSPIRPKVDAGQHYLLAAAIGEFLRTPNRDRQGEAARRASEHARDAVGAAVVAAILHLEEGARAR